MLSTQKKIMLINILNTNLNKIEIIINCHGFIKMHDTPFWFYDNQIVVTVNVDGMKTQHLLTLLI